MPYSVQRPLLLATALFLGGGVFAAVGVTDARAADPKAAAKDDSRFFPDDCQYVVVVRVDQLLNSEAFKLMKKEVPEAVQDNTSDLMGLAFADIDQLVMAAHEKDQVGIVHAKQAVKAADIQANLKKGNPKIEFKETKAGDFTMYECKSSEPGASPPTFCIVDDHRIVIAEKADMVIAFLKRDKAPELSDGLKAAMKLVDPNAAVTVAGGSKKIFSGQLGPDVEKFFTKATGVAVSFVVAADVEVSAVVICPDKDAADQARDGVKKAADAYKAGFSLFAKDMPAEVADVFNVDPKVDGTNVTFKKTIKVAPLVEYMKEQKKGPDKPPKDKG
jgi:hypothetical protein